MPQEWKLLATLYWIKVHHVVFAIPTGVRNATLAVVSHHHITIFTSTQVISALLALPFVLFKVLLVRVLSYIWVNVRVLVDWGCVFAVVCTGSRNLVTATAE